jgi:hypothetical protein
MMGSRMRRPLVLLGASVALALIAAWLLGIGPPGGLGRRAVSPAAHGGIRSLQLVPFPEGPNSPLFEPPPVSQGSLPLTAVEASIPDPLPAPSWQGFMCKMGGNLEVTFEDGEGVSYGPCERPASIDRLWGRMIAAMNDQ